MHPGHTYEAIAFREAGTYEPKKDKTINGEI